MLWLKGWYETRSRLLILMVTTLAIFGVAWDSVPTRASLSAEEIDATTLIGASLLAAVMLAGAGIKTQPGAFRPTKGLHGSMYYTLSLPVSRSRLFAVRVSIGLLETAVIHTLICTAVWWIRPVLRLHATSSDVLKHDTAAFFCVAAMYCIGVLFATFLDDLYQTWATISTLMSVIVILNRVPLPTSLDAVLVLSRASPLITHTMPWVAIAVLFAVSALLLLASVAIIQSREY